MFHSKFGQRRQLTVWMFASLLVICLLLLGACTTPATPAASTIPEITVDVGADSVSLPAAVPSGIVAVKFNTAEGVSGTPEIARLNEGVTMEQLNEALAQPDPTAALALVTLLGSAQGSSDNKVVYDLKPGAHAAVLFPDNAAPVVGAFTAGEASQATAPQAAVTAQLADFSFTLPDSIKTGPQLWHIQNMGKQWHEMVIVKLNEGVTVDNLMEMLQSEQTEGPPPFEQVAMWAPNGAGEQAWVTFDLPAGEYTVLCFLPDVTGDGTPHLAHGMVRTLTVTE